MKPNDSVAMPRKIPLTRKAGKPTTAPTKADKPAATAKVTGNGVPWADSTAATYAPTPMNAALPIENKPVKPANSIRPKPMML